MEYLRFPFGKYKGVAIEELPSTYIVLALESFDLPDELKDKMLSILLGKFNTFKNMMNLHIHLGPKQFKNVMLDLSLKYDKNPNPF